MILSYRVRYPNGLVVTKDRRWSHSEGPPPAVGTFVTVLTSGSEEHQSAVLAPTWLIENARLSSTEEAPVAKHSSG